MKRDMDLIREMLIRLEEGDMNSSPFTDLKSQGYTSEQLRYHAWLLMDAGLAEGADATHSGSAHREAILNGLTWNGHEFLDAARDAGRWAKAKTMLSAIGGFSLAVMQQLLTELMKKELGL